MKIKTWLLMTYLIVMLLPLLAFYGLYVSINAYYQDKNVEEYFEKWNTISNIKKTLENKALYVGTTDFHDIEDMTSDELIITLYAPNGRILFSSNPLASNSLFEKKNNLYKNLFDFKQNYETYVYKEPIYADGQIVGLYKITAARMEWVEQVHSKMILVVSSIVLVLIILYSSVIYFLNKRLNRPLRLLMRQMDAFAKGKPTKNLPVTKDEIGQLSESFQAMQKEIEETRKKLQVEQQQKQFMIATLSHDLKTPLTSIQAYTESLQEGTAKQETAKEYLQIIATKSVYMKQLLDDLMMFSLLQSPSYEMERVTVDGEEFFDMLLADYEDISKEKGFTFETSNHVFGQYSVNPKQLMRVLDNLMSNAWVHTNPNGTIRLAAFEASQKPDWCIATCEKQGVYIVVQNNGTTVEPSQLDKIFEPLYQVEQSRSQVGQRGAGLGLSIAKQILEKHDGTIEAISKHNETAIVCWLPKEIEQ